MCCASIHLLIGALFVFAVENEATTTSMISSTEITTAPVSMAVDTTTLFYKTSNDFPDNITTPNSTVALSNMADGNTTSDGQSDSPTPPPPEHPQTNNYTTDKPQSSTKTMIKGTTSRTTTTPAKKPRATNNGSALYIIILIVVVLCLSGIVVYCCLQKNSRKYAVDLHPKQDAQIPLSTVDIDVIDTTSVKDIQTFTPVESTVPLQDPAPVKEAEKPEGGKESADVKQENPQNLSSTQATVNTKDKTDGLAIVDLTDGELTTSTKTSMESLDDVLNENNSNNTGAEVNGNGHEFTEISIDTLPLK
ncbi:uncharacterized protein LOC113114234 [Carassius auratus]|uniref:Uncharacterized protein LOC113114234 n=1 Tax=Carassius auratus TaxID=7957 RepID=A0A6P6QTQ9_CARAU|nr:uncharacterized protein LOC113114234 [Carassius auratus]XP_026136864.1 uncharacterized protein LOC113114234 [Carassius auratus]